VTTKLFLNAGRLFIHRSTPLALDKVCIPTGYSQERTTWVQQLCVYWC